MADMTFKHHTLIKDAIVEGITDFLQRKQVLYAVRNDGLPSTAPMTDEEAIRVKHVLHILASTLSAALCNSFAGKLAYTNDHFNNNEWTRVVRLAVEDAANKVLN